MRRVTWAAMSTSTPMGQQAYESEIRRSVASLAGDGWEFRALEVGSLRSTSAGARKFPAGLYAKAPLRLALLLGAACYRTRGLVHRLDLRIPPSPGPEIVTIHDLPPMRFADEGALPAAAAAGARRAELVICPSTFAAAEVHDLLGVAEDRIRVIFNGLGPAFDDPVPFDDAALARLGVREPFVLHAAGATQRKNLAALAEAWRHVSAEIPAATLVLCGPADARRDALFATEASAVRLGRLEPSQIASLMLRAAAVVVPSTYEGFGLPALEGMACGRPVVAARAGALPEICADAAVLVDPTADGLAEGLVTALTDTRVADRLSRSGPTRAASFTWDAAAVAHLAAYRHVLDGREA